MFLRYMNNLVGYHHMRNSGDDTLTGRNEDSTRCVSGLPSGQDCGMLVVAKKATLPENNVASAFVARYGLEAYAASIDTLTITGPKQVYTVLHIASSGGLGSNLASAGGTLVDNAKVAVAWHRNHHGRHVGPPQVNGVRRGDWNNDQQLTPGDVVTELNAVFLGSPEPQPRCVGDINGDGSLTPSDVVLLLNGTFLGSGCPRCLELCI